MTKKPLVGILTTMTAPLLPLLLRSLYQQGLSNLCVIADEKNFSAKDREIWIQRTGGAFDSLGVEIYDFSKNVLPFYLVKNHNGDDCLELLKKKQPALLINGGTPRKLTRPILDFPKYGVINVHPGILPKYRGSSCVEWAILNDDPIGNTAHFMTEGYDEGPIIDSEVCHFSSDDDYVSMRVEVYRRSISMMARTVVRVLRSGMQPSDGIKQSGGEFFRPISNVQLDEVVEKIRSGLYVHLRQSN